MTTVDCKSGYPDNFPKAIGRGRMSATWQYKDSKDWNFAERRLARLGLTPSTAPAGAPAKPPVYSKDTPVPVYPVWKQHWFIAPKAVAPLLADAALDLLGFRLNKPWVVVLYSAYFSWYGLQVMLWVQEKMLTFGTFDGQAPRDGVPDVDTWKTAIGLMMFTLSRMSLSTSLLYKPNEPILDFKTILFLPINLFVYAVVLDFYFYWYHRSMHEVHFLWKFHRKHHTTKHPIAALSAFADHEQEICDMIVIPALAWLTWRVNFATWWMSMCYVMFYESSGHSGIRSHFQNPITWPLRYLGIELTVEDHDIHHRQGWKKSGNYGKQTRVWDALFGTLKPRIESKPDNIDWNDRMDKPRPIHNSVAA